MERVRVLMCGSSTKVHGGMNSVVNQLMRHNWGDNIKLIYLPTHTIGNNFKKIFYFSISYIKLFFLLLFNRFDVVHLHMSYKGSFYRKYYVSKLCKKFNKKVIIHLHGSEFKDFYNRADDKLKKQIIELFSMVDCTIALGNEWFNFIKSIVPNANVEIINNAVKIPKEQKLKSSDENKFLFLGALIERKGVQDLIEAAKILKSKGIKKFKCLIAGDGPEKDKLVNLVKKYELEDNFEFLGWINGIQKQELLINSDVLILPSYNEGLPIAILEAMSYSLPIISTDVGSISEAVKENCNGYLIKPGDYNALEKAMSYMILDEKLWGDFSKQSRTIAESYFSEDTFFDKISKLYLKLSELVD